MKEQAGRNKNRDLNSKKEKTRSRVKKTRKKK